MLSIFTLVFAFVVSQPVLDEGNIYHISISNSQDYQIYKQLHSYLIRNFPNSFLTRNIKSLSLEKPTDLNSHQYHISPGSYRIYVPFNVTATTAVKRICYMNHNQIDIKVNRELLSTGMEPIHTTITLTGFKEVLNYVMETIWSELNTKKTNMIKIIQNSGLHKHILKRNMDTVYLPDGLGRSLINDLQRFYDSYDIYHKFGMPYRRGYLLSGPPGTGKTTVIHAIASYFDKAINVISIDDHMDRNYLMSILDRTNQNTIIVIEDIDALYNGRETRSGVSFSDFINIIDGLSSNEGTILFMTTNHVDKIDPAILRPGRADRIIKLDYATRAQFLAIYKAYCPDQLHRFSEFLVGLPTDITTATLQKFFFLHLGCENILDYKEELMSPLNSF